MSESSVKADDRGRRTRLAVAVVIGASWLGLGGYAFFDWTTSTEEAVARGDAELVHVATVLDALNASENQRLEGILMGLRVSIRAQDVWTSPELGASGGSEALEAERLRAVLRGALEKEPLLGSLQLVVAGHSGLWSLGVERHGDELQPIVWPPRMRDGMTKALWYADEISRAVASGGRRVERGDVSFEAAPGDMASAGEETPTSTGRPIAQIAVGLHDPTQLVQGALVGSIDLERLSERLDHLVPEDVTFTCVSMSGGVIHGDAEGPGAANRLGSLAVRVMEGGDGIAPFDAEGHRILGRPLATGAEAGQVGAAGQTLALLERDVAPTGLVAWARSPWPIVVVLYGGVALLAIVSLLRSGATAARKGGAQAKATPMSESTDDSTGITLHNERIAIREWLSDVRGCLEREAATRGLSVHLRCERSLPDDLESDAAWLGGLLIAIGREALDATAGEGVLVEVVEEANDTLRFEVDAGGTTLTPLGGMNEVATSLGARLEAGRAGRLAVVLPTALA